MRIKKKFHRDGVILFKNVWSKKYMESIRDEYQKVKNNCIRKRVPKNKPIIVLWNHSDKGKKKICLFAEFSSVKKLIKKKIIPILKKNIINKNFKIRLLETVVFHKPYKISNKIHWHQDSSTWPIYPNNQVAVWIPFSRVDKKSGALSYALKTHKEGIRRSVSLHNNKPYVGDKRKLIPNDPEKSGFKVKCMNMHSTDMLCHHGNTWHTSEPNTKLKEGRSGISIRFIIGDVKYIPNPGQAATFVKQIKIRPGEIIKGSAFPRVS